MEPFVFFTTVHLDKPARDIVWDTIASVGNKNAHKIVVECRSGGKVVDLAGMSMNMYVQRHDEGSFVIEGKAENKCAAFTLTKNCYNVEGRICCTIEIADANATVTVARIYLLVRKKQGDVVIDPENRIESLSEIIAQLDYLKETTEKANQAVSSANTATNAANTAAQTANTAAGNANAAAKAANDAASAANNAANSVEEQKNAASEAANRANAAAQRGETAAGQAEGVIQACTNAAQAANYAADNANTAAEGVDAKVTAAQTAAENAEADAADTRSRLEGVNREIESLKLTDASKIDGAYLDENGKLCLTANGELVAGPFAVAGGGNGTGGGVSNAATLTVTNESGFLAKTIALGGACPITLTWSSTEDGMATGAGVLVVKVGGSTKLTRNIDQGTVPVDVGSYLAAGSNAVKVQISDAYGNSRVINFSITTVAVSLDSAFDASVPFTGAISFTYIPTGSVSKTMHFELDGKEIGTATVAVSGRQQTYVIDAQNHGAHALRVWFTCEIDGTEVTSNELYYELICLKAGDTTPIITSTFRTDVVDQFASLVISWRVYDPAKLTTDVTLIANDEVVSELVNVDRTEQKWTYRAVDAGALVLEIVCGEESKMLGVYVNAVDLNVSAETQDLALYLTSYGRSNSEADPGVWTYKEIAATFRNFNWVSDGWQLDGKKNTVLRVTGDARVEIPYQIFASDFRGTGKTIEIEFGSGDVLDYDAMILSSVSGGRGIEITAQRADMTSEQSTIGTQYKEDEHVRLTFVTEKRSGNRLILIYLNGIISGIKQYPDDDDFSQGVPVGISIGSNDCTIDIYNIRVYDNDLTRYQVLDNWIADTQDAEEMLARYERNEIYDDYGTVVKENLPKTLPYMVLEGPQLPTVKGTKVALNGYYVDPLQPEKSFTFTGASADVQGTSSKDYYVKNFKIKFSNGFVVNGEQRATYAMREDSIPVNTFTFKADVASSEGANNVELVRLYNDIAPGKTPPQAGNALVRQGIDGMPIVMFWDNGSEIKFLGKYNFNNDKATEEVFGFTSGDESWEIRNNVSDRVMFKKLDFEDTSTETGWPNDFEARYPEGSTNTSNLEAFIGWVMTTDRDTATGNALGASVTYEGTTYTTDSADYRLAKFRAELADHADVTSAQFYWLFTEFFLMVDSRAKNAFPTRYAANGKWCWLPYDMDTAIGINNEGALAFDYGLEDTDTTESGAQVFNGQQSVFWCNVRDAFASEIKAMYVDLRTKNKLTYSDVMARFDAHQSAWPEAIMNEDAYRKYIEPYEVEGSTMYFAMCQGKKELQRTWWLYNRFRYMDAKYDTGDVASDSILIRIYGDADIDLVPYADTYLRAKFGSYQNEVRAKRGNEYTLHCFVDTANDLETTIFPASLIAEIADLSGYKIGLANFAKATKLQVLKIGDGTQGYSNGNLTELSMGNNTLLRHLDVRNCPNLAQAVDLSGCSNIEEVYFDGTSITGLSLPNGGMVKTLHLPGTVTNFTLLNQSKITDFVLPSYSQITTLRLENVSSVIDTAAILAAIPANSRVRLIGLNWTMNDAEAVLALYDRLDLMRGLDENGNNMDTAQVSGTLHIDALTGAQLAEMQSRYPYITIDYKHITSYCYFYNYDGSTLLYTAAVQDGGDATYSGSTPSRSSTAQYTYSFVGWSTSKNATSASTNALKAITADRSVYAAFSATVRTYTVYFYNGSTLLQTVTNVPYGGSATYTGDTPVDAENGQPFEGWAPSPSGIIGNTSCYAQFVSAREVVEITDDWATIFAAIDDGSYVTKYKVGNYKPLDLGTEGIINMQIAGFNKDPRADGVGTAAISWIGVELLNTSHRMNPSLVTNYNEETNTAWEQNNDGEWATLNQGKGSTNASATWSITASTAGTLTVSYKVGSESNYDKLTVKVNNSTVANSISGTVDWSTYDVECTDGDVVTVTASYSKDGSGDQNGDTAYIKFSSTGTIAVAVESNAYTVKTVRDYQTGTGSIGGWESSEMRSYMQDTIFPLIPEEVRNRIVTVTKTHPAYNTSGNSFTQTTQDAVWFPSYNEVFGTSSLYKALFESTNANRVKYKVGASSASWWWLRSAYSSYAFHSVGTDGSFGNYGAYASGAVPLGFCT